MNMAGDWIELIRETFPFVLFEHAKNREDSPWYVDTINLTFPRDSLSNGSLDYSIPGLFPVEFEESPGFIYISGASTVGSTDFPVASPGPSQRADQITMIWTKRNDEVVEYHYDETVGMPAPPGVVTFNDTTVYDGMNTGTSGSFYGLDVTPHREDGYPAVVTVTGLKKWYHEGQLCRTDGIIAAPALKADMVGAIWAVDGEDHRAGGPARILVENYSEYYNDHGEMRHHDYQCISEVWDRGQPESVVGETQPLSTRYFTDIQDEMFYTARGIS